MTWLSLVLMLLSPSPPEVLKFIHPVELHIIANVSPTLVGQAKEVTSAVEGAVNDHPGFVAVTPRAMPEAGTYEFWVNLDLNYDQKMILFPYRTSAYFTVWVSDKHRVRHEVWMSGWVIQYYMNEEDMKLGNQRYIRSCINALMLAILERDEGTLDELIIETSKRIRIINT